MDSNSKTPNKASFKGNLQLVLENPFAVGTIIGLIIIFLLYVVVWVLIKRRTSRRGILLLGLCESGKTLLFSYILHNKYVQTYTSMKENVGVYNTSKGDLTLIDIPGQERVRGKFWDQFKSSARALIFVLDSSTLQKDIRDVAEYLYIILTDSVISQIKPAVLIVCNKQDHTTVKSASVIQNQLERELNLLRQTKDKQLDSTDSRQGKSYFLGNPGSDFTFAQLGPQSVEFVEAFALPQSSQIEPITNWLNQIA